MKKTIITALIVTLSLFALTGCGASDEPKTDADLAAQHNMTNEELQEMKEAAARMSMGIEDHMKMMGDE
jgi:hypothetical protein